MPLDKNDLVQMTEEFQCPGCVCGMNTSCGQYEVHHERRSCANHVLGTRCSGVGAFALGLPKGFNRPGSDTNQMIINFASSDEDRCYDYLNIPVWALEQDNFLFVRKVMPRLGQVITEVIKDGKAQDLPDIRTHDVAEFIDEID